MPFKNTAGVLEQGALHKMSDHDILSSAVLPLAGESGCSFAERVRPSAAGRDRCLAFVSHTTNIRDTVLDLEVISARWLSLPAEQWGGEKSMLTFAMRQGLAVGAWAFPVAVAGVDAAWSALLSVQESFLYSAASPLCSSPERGEHYILRAATPAWHDRADVGRALQSIRQAGFCMPLEYHVTTCSYSDTSESAPVETETLVLWTASQDCPHPEPAHPTTLEIHSALEEPSPRGLNLHSLSLSEEPAVLGEASLQSLQSLQLDDLAARQAELVRGQDATRAQLDLPKNDCNEWALNQAPGQRAAPVGAAARRALTFSPTHEAAVVTSSASSAQRKEQRARDIRATFAQHSQTIAQTSFSPPPIKKALSKGQQRRAQKAKSKAMAALAVSSISQLQAVLIAHYQASDMPPSDKIGFCAVVREESDTKELLQLCEAEGIQKSWIPTSPVVVPPPTGRAPMSREQELREKGKQLCRKGRQMKQLARKKAVKDASLREEVLGVNTPGAQQAAARASAPEVMPREFPNNNKLTLGSQRYESERADFYARMCAELWANPGAVHQSAATNANAVAISATRDLKWSVGSRNGH